MQKSLSNLKKTPCVGLERFSFSTLSWLPGELRARGAEAGVCKSGVRHFENASYSLQWMSDKPVNMSKPSFLQAPLLPVSHVSSLYKVSQDEKRRMGPVCMYLQVMTSRWLLNDRAEPSRWWPQDCQNPAVSHWVTVRNPPLPIDTFTLGETLCLFV